MKTVNYKSINLPTVSAEEYERQWRDSELAATDWIVQIPDHPKKLQYTAYRKQLRDYPTQPDFPNGERPIKP